MIEKVDPNKSIDIWELVNRIFNDNKTITKSQYIDNLRSTNIIPEAALWLDIFKLTVDDWLCHKMNRTSETASWVREIERWVFKDSLGMDLMSLAIYVAFKIEPDYFKKMFRKWLRSEQQAKLPVKLFPVILEPFEDFSRPTEMLI